MASVNVERTSAQLTNSQITYQAFIQSHYTTKESGLIITNTRIGDKNRGISGGSFHIPETEYQLFLQLYYNEIVAHGKPEYLTEKQLTNGLNPILVDIDLRYNYAVTTRHHTDMHIEDMVSIYLEELKAIFRFDENTRFQIYIFEKDSVNRVADKQITKDGIHMIIGLQADHQTQTILRKRVLPKLEEAWTDIPITNTWHDVLDEGISNGPTNWQLYGSRKPNHEPYKLTRIFNITYDPTDSEMMMDDDGALSAFNVSQNFNKLSARYSEHPAFPYRAEFAKLRSTTPALVRQVPANRAIITDSASSNADIANIKNRDELENTVADFLDKIKLDSGKFELREAYDYTMTLPSSYYGMGSFSKWIRVGWALRNISDALFIVWVAFSSQAPNFDYSSIRDDLYGRWQGFDVNSPKGLTKRSIMYWSKQDATEAYNAVRATCVDYYIDLTIDAEKLLADPTNKALKGSTDFDIATVLYHFYKDEFKCVSVKDNIWYMYRNHRWVKSDSGTQLRKLISTSLRNAYRKRAFNSVAKLMTTDTSNLTHMEPAAAAPATTSSDSELPAKSNPVVDKILDICQRLGRTNDKKNIMTEAKELFYDETFFQKLDINPYLLCFNNGVFDFKEKAFRRGYPEDYVSKTTNIDYNPLNPAKDLVIMNEIHDFMKKLFPVPELLEYMWDHLASTLIGTSANQTFNMYIGVGQNGKSVLVSLMEKILGEYKGDVPLSLIMDKRTKIGGLAPELVALKGIRYAVMQEPSKGDRINEGIMKQITSGVDPIQARAPYMTEALTFVPQFKLVVCSNEFMEIKSQDHGTWRRIRVVDFLSLFTENPVTGDRDKPYQYLLDRHITEKFNSWKEIFASMLVERAVKSNGVVKDCPMVMASSNSYRESQDYIAEFIRDKVIVDAAGRITKTELSSEFSIWYQSTYGKGGPSPKDVQTYMDRRFGKFEKHKAWIGARINYERDGGGVVEDEEDDIDLSGL